jgi:hypothetical protein
MKVVHQYQTVCESCSSIGIHLESGEGAPSSMQISCRGCGAPRGTLGALRQLARTGSEEFIELQNQGRSSQDYSL